MSAITFGVLSQSIAIRSKTFAATIVIDGATSATIRPISALAGANWNITKNTNAQDIWLVTGTAPSFLGTFQLEITATNATTTAKKSYRVTTTANGALSDDQAFVLGLDGLALWLDASENSSLVKSGSSVTRWLDLAQCTSWNLSSSETITTDTSAFSAQAISFSSTQFSNGFNTAIALDTASINVADRIASDRGVTVADPSGHSTVFMVLSYNESTVSDTSSFYAFDTLTYTNGSQTVVPDECLLGSWGVQAQSQGTSDLAIYCTSDERALQTKTANQYKAITRGVKPGNAMVLCYRFGPNGLSVRINRDPVPLAYLSNNYATTTPGDNVWFSNFTPPKSIGMLGSPYGYCVGSVGAVIAVKGYLSDSKTAQVEDYLMRKFMAGAAPIPTIRTITTKLASTGALYDYVDQPFTAEFVISNGNGNPTTAGCSISTTTSGAWSIAKISPSDNTRWRVSGTMPASAGDFLLTVWANTDKMSVSDSFKVTTLAAPPAPIFYGIATTQALVGDLFETEVSVGNVDPNVNSSFTITADKGGSWTASLSGADPSKLLVAGRLPANPTTTTITIVAKNQFGAQTQTTTQSYQIRSVEAPTEQAVEYDLDPTGTLEANYIENETHVLTPDNGADRQFIVPIYNPFYATNFKLVYLAGGYVPQEAIAGKDFEFVYCFNDLSTCLDSPVYGAIAILNQALQGVVKLSYQQLGGGFVYDRNKLYAYLANLTANPRQTAWDLVTNKPNYMRASEHFHDLDGDFVGLGGSVLVNKNTATTAATWGGQLVSPAASDTQTVSSLMSMVASLSTSYNNLSYSSDLASMVTHLARTNNPHNLTKSQIGLDRVQNYPLATAAQAIDPTNNSTYLTPATAALAGQAGLTVATTTASGIVKLNSGSDVAAAYNDTDALTAAGAIALYNAQTANSFSTAFANTFTLAQVTPQPVTFPCYWKGRYCANLAELIVAVQTFTGVRNLYYVNSKSGFLFPREVTPPSLVVYSSPQNTTLLEMDIDDDVDAALFEYTA